VTAAFLNFVAEKYDARLVRKLNQALREGTYSPAIWKRLTKKSVDQLDEEWRASLQAAASFPWEPRLFAHEAIARTDWLTWFGRYYGLPCRCVT
jgi:hypothetical protein